MADTLDLILAFELAAFHKSEDERRKDGAISRRGCRPGVPVALNLHRKHRPEYIAWSQMRTRTRNPKCQDWPHYGGRGITVCSRWDSFAAFLADMGQKPSRGHSLDRIDGNGNYDPGNCRWATAKEQARNWRTRNHKLTLGGETLPLCAWAERLGWRAETIRDRLAAGWTVERALTTPPIKRRERISDGTFAKALGY